MELSIIKKRLLSSLIVCFVLGLCIIASKNTYPLVELQAVDVIHEYDVTHEYDLTPGKLENVRREKQLRQLDYIEIEIAENMEYSKIPEKLEKRLESVLLENSFDKFISEYGIETKEMDNLEIYQYIAKDTSGILRDYKEDLEHSDDTWFRVVDEPYLFIRHPLEDGQFVYYEYLPKGYRYEYPYMMRALGKNEDFSFIRWEENIYLITPLKKGQEQIGMITYCMNDKNELGWALYQERTTETYVVTKYYEYIMRENGGLFDEFPAFEKKTNKYEYISDNYWYRVDGSTMYYGDWYHVTEQPQQLMDYCVEALQKGNLIEQLKEIEIESEIIGDSEKEEILALDRDLGLSYYVEGFDDDDIWYKVLLSGVGEDVLVTHQGDDGIVLNFYFWNYIEEDHHIDVPICVGGQKKSNPYFIGWEDKKYLAIPFWDEEIDKLIGVLIYSFAENCDAGGGIVMEIGINSDGTVNKSVEGFFPVITTNYLPEGARTYPQAVEY